MKNYDQPGWHRALARYEVVTHVEAYVLAGLTLAGAIAKAREVQALKEGSRARDVSRASVYQWYAAYRASGLAGLYDRPRKRPGSGLPESFLTFLCKEKSDDPDASIPEVIARAREREVIAKTLPLDRTTVFRAARALNLPMLRRRKADATRMRPFAYERRMMMVLCDGKHFRAGSEGLKRVALIFIDDATRYVLGIFVGVSESSDFFLSSLFSVIQTYGLMDALYLDNGSGFKNGDADRVFANLKIPLIHGQVEYPEGRAKIERFNSTITQDLLRGLRKPGIDPSLSALELRLRHYIQERYNPRLHSNINAVPKERFDMDSKPLKFTESNEILSRSFVLSESRKVRRDNVISWDGVIYEVPFGYSGRIVTIYRNVVSRKIWLLHRGAATILHPPDLGLNAREGRQGERKKEPTQGPITTAAEIHFNRDFGPVVSPDGGFTKTSNPNKESSQ